MESTTIIELKILDCFVQIVTRKHLRLLENLKGQKRRLVQKNDFCTCGKKKTIRCAMCKECFKQYKADNLTKIKWPSNDDLIQMIKELNYVQVGKILGVSDGAIRHRLKCRGLLPNKKSK